MKMYQQGDVLLKSCEKIPQDAKKVEPNQYGYVLAYGEVTGHKHALEDIENIEMFEKDGKFYVRIKKESVLTHEEHKPITLPEGNWEVGIVREFDHFLEEARNVQD